MVPLLEYIVKSAVSLAVFYSFYWVLLRKDTHFVQNRIILVTSLILAFILPLINLNIEQPEPVIPTLNLNFDNPVSQISAITHAEEAGWGIWKFITIIYLVGAAFVFLRLVYQSIYMQALSRLSKSEKHNDFTLVYMEKDIIPFSYFNKIFIPESVSAEHGLQSIIDHERSHLKQMHFVDLFLVEVLTIIQWFNPFAWLYERSVKEVHEYLADHSVLSKGYNQGNYQALLVNQAMGGPVFTIANQFNQSLIKKRIVMMTKMKSPRLAQLKSFLLLPVIAIVLMAYNQPEKAVEVLKGSVPESTSLDKPVDPPAIPQSSAKSNVSVTKSAEQIKIEGTVISFETNKELTGVNVVVKGTMVGTKTDASGRYSILVPDNEAVLVFSYIGYESQAIPVKWEKRIDIMMREYALDINFSQPNYLVTPDQSPGFTNSNGEVFVAVEELPSYPGGTDALKKFIADNLKFPVDAKRAEITGMVLVTYVIDSDGKLINPKIRGSLFPSMDEEALRVTRLIKGWQPAKQNGKPVACQVNMPVAFK